MLKVIEHIDLYIWQAVERQPDWSQLKSYSIASMLNAFEWDFLWHGTDIASGFPRKIASNFMRFVMYDF